MFGHSVEKMKRQTSGRCKNTLKKKELTDFSLRPSCLCFCLIVCEKGFWHLFHRLFHQLHSVLLSAVFSQISPHHSLFSHNDNDWCAEEEGLPNHRQTHNQMDPLTKTGHTNYTAGRHEDRQAVNRAAAGKLSQSAKKHLIQFKHRWLSLYNTI